jgi:hypothetical protein
MSLVPPIENHIAGDGMNISLETGMKEIFSLGEEVVLYGHATKGVSAAESICEVGLQPDRGKTFTDIVHEISPEISLAQEQLDNWQFIYKDIIVLLPLSLLVTLKGEY